MSQVAFTPMILSGVKQVLVTPWTNDGTDDVLDLTGTRYDLQHLVGDTVQILQDDNESNEIPCETRDEPLYEAIKLGKYQVSMESGDINPLFLNVCMGFGLSGDGKIAYAPAAYKKLFLHLEVVMDGASFIVPRFQISSKTQIESLKTGIARGVVAGTAYSVDVVTGSGTKRATPFFVVQDGGTAPEIYALGKAAGTYEDDTVGGLRLSPSSLSFAAAGGTKVVNVLGNGGTPTVSVASAAQSWLSASYDNGAIAVTAASGSSARTGKITVTDGGNSVELNVSQSAT